MRHLNRILLAVAVFAAVAYLPDLLTSGPAGGETQDRLRRLFDSSGPLLAFGLAFVGGVLTSLTPCVYPLIPITVSIFGARKAGRGEAALLSGLYVLGIGAMYTGLGVGAALTGQAFGGIMSNPVVIGAVALVFAVMAASMFGAFELALPAGLQARLSAVGGAGRAGAFGMGLVAGVIAAPCTGPVLTSILLLIAKEGSVALGAGLMLSFALGMGLLFFLIGAFSLSLPKSGAWMETVKSVFGAALLAAAAIYLKDILPGLRPVFSAAPAAAVAAAAVAAAGVLLGALHLSFHGAPPERSRKAFALLLLVLGAAYGAGAAGARERHRAEQSFAWHGNYQEAVALAKASGRPIILDFWAEWCTACKELDKVAWSDPRVQQEAARFVAVKADGTDSSDAFMALADQFGVVGMPTVVFIDGKGREVRDRIVGAVDAEEMLRRLKAVDGACGGAIATGALACAVRW
ncbi:MAG: thioredoxin fold domain-containing protein [Anaeromyxobacteraceae bacterium]|nr:thioredoxin fold domain-containing protein [Anaeromyxobacteraceae bacterium]